MLHHTWVQQVLRSSVHCHVPAVLPSLQEGHQSPLPWLELGPHCTCGTLFGCSPMRRMKMTVSRPGSGVERAFIAASDTCTNAQFSDTSCCPCVKTRRFRQALAMEMPRRYYWPRAANDNCATNGFPDQMQGAFCSQARSCRSTKKTSHCHRVHAFWG